MAYILPGRQAALELQRTHERTFAIEPKENEPFILYLKLTPTQTLSVINGAPIELVIGSPVIQPNMLTFTLKDVIGSPFWISRTLEPNRNASQISEVFSGLPRIFEQLAQASQIQVGLFDWDTICLHAECVQISRPKQSLDEWIERCLSSQAIQVEKGQELEYGYALSLDPLSEEPDFTYIDMALKRKLGDEPYLVSTNKYSDRLSISEYLEEGKHGYYQEHLLTTELSKYFQPGIDLFVSPRTRNNTELTDFVLAEHETIILIESKASSPYEGTPRKTSAVESSLTRLVRKAFEQLQRAQEVVIQNPTLIEDIKLRESCIQFENVIGICIVDDAWMINPKSLKTSLNQVGMEIQDMGVYILEIEDFFGLLAHSRSTKSLIEFLLQLSRSIPNNGEVPLFHVGF